VRLVEFIFMLTHHDVTIPNALQVLEEVKNTGLKCIGCKDIGLNLKQYEELFTNFGKYGIESFLEVVSYSEQEHFQGIDLALRVGADNLIGGMPSYTKKTVDYLRQKRARTHFFPYIGRITGHPCALGGTIEEIINDGKDAEKFGINGINLLLYRYANDQRKLLRATRKELNVPLIVAGNVADFTQIEELKESNVWAFTIGGAVLEKKFVENGSTNEQIQAILKKL
jgi:hypothetical protein